MKISLEDFKKGCNEVKWDGKVHHPPLTYNFNVHGARVDLRDFVRTCLSFTAITIMSEKFQDVILDSNAFTQYGLSNREVYRKLITGEGFYTGEELETDISLEEDPTRTKFNYCDEFISDVTFLTQNSVFRRIETISQIVEKIVSEYCFSYVTQEWYLVEEISKAAKYISVALMTRNVENGDK